MRDYTDVHSNSHTQTKVTAVNNILEAQREIQKLVDEGYSKENLYVLTHSDERTEHVADYTDTNRIGVAEEGVITAIANLFRSQGDELRAKLRSMGVSKEHAEYLEMDMDKGKIIILAWKGELYEGDRYDPLIEYYPFL